MIESGGHITTDELLIVHRYNQHRYRISMLTYHRIVEMIKFYNESIYSLPDFEVIEAIGADDENEGVKEILQVNEIVFL